MPVPRILARYVLREVVQYAALGLVGVGSILITQNFLRQLSDVGSVGIATSDLIAVVGCLTAMLAAYAIPVAFLFGVLVAVGRLSSDSEITAMRALGVSLGQLVVPCLLLSLLVSAATGVLLHEVEPSARRELRAVAAGIAARGGIIESGRFRKLDQRGDRLLLVDRRTVDNELQGVMISDRTNTEMPFTVMATRGRFDFDAEAAVAHLELEEGDIHFEPAGADDESYRRISFGSFDYTFDMSDVLGARLEQVRPPEMKTSTILGVLEHFRKAGSAPDWARVTRKDRYEIQLHRRLALPVAPVLFALIGIPLGLQRSRGARSWGVLLCIALVFSYYAVLSFGIYLAEEKALPAALTLWIPNLVFGATAGLLLYRARRAEI